jgi:hypothetical protein
VKISLFLAAIGVAAALVVPVASGSTAAHHAKKVKHGGTNVTKVHKVTKPGVAKILPAPLPVFPSGTLGGTLPDPSVADCTSYGGNCTTIEYCEIWGDNCPSMVPDSSGLVSVPTQDLTISTDGTPANP